MEPFTLVTIASAAWEGFAGHKIDQIASKSFSAISRRIKKMRQDGELPPNHDLYKVLQLSMLDATDYLVDITNGVMEMNEVSVKSDDLANWKILKKGTDKWIKEWKRSNERESFLGKEDSAAYAEIEKMLIVDTNKTFKEVENALVNRVKSEWLNEWQTGIAMDVPEIVEELLMKGWLEDGKPMDWFSITALLFAENLKEEKYIKARNAFQNRLLSEIKTETGIIGEAMSGLAEVFTKTFTDYDFIKQKLIGHGNLIAGIKETTDQSLRYVKEIHSALEGSIRIEVLQENKSISKLLGRIKQLEEEVAEKYNEKEEYKVEMAANPRSKSAKKAFDATLKEWEDTAEQLQRRKLDFEIIKDAYLRQKKVFESINWETANDRLKRSRKKFYEGGNVKVVDDILLYDKREKDLKTLLKEKERMSYLSKNFSEEELMLALNRLRDIEDINRFEKAKQHFETSIEVFESYNNYFEYADFLSNQNNHSASIEVFKKLLIFLGESDLFKKAVVLNRLGTLYVEMRNYKDSEGTLTESLAILRTIAEKDSGSNESEIALVLNSLGRLYFQIQRYQDSEASFSDSLSILRKLDKNDPGKVDSQLAMTLSNLGNLCIIEQRYHEAINLFSESLSLFHKLAEKNANSYDQNIVSTLNSLGIFYMKVRRYQEAEINYLSSLAISRKLAESNPDAFEPEMVKVMHNLGTLYNKERRYKEATEISSESLLIYRKLVVKKQDAYEPDMMITLINEGNSFFYFEKFKKAELSFSESLSICRRLVEMSPDAFEPDLAMMLSNLGNLFVVTKRYDEAERSLLESLSIRRRLAERNPDRFEPTMATTFGNLGRLYYMDLGHHDDALKMYSEALQLLLKHYLKNPDYYLKEVLDICFSMSDIFIFHGKKEKVEECLFISISLLHKLRHSAEHQEYFQKLNDLLKRNGSSYDEIVKRLHAIE